MINFDAGPTLLFSHSETDRTSETWGDLENQETRKN